MYLDNTLNYVSLKALPVDNLRLIDVLTLVLLWYTLRILIIINIMETKNLTLQESILIAVVILVIALFGVQYSKQKSIERQQAVKIQAEQKEKAEAKKERDLQEILLSACLSTANDDYWAYMKLNGTENDDGTVWASDYFWKTGKADKKVAEDSCYKKYR